MAQAIGVEDISGSLEADVGALTVEWAPCSDQDIGECFNLLILSLPECVVLMAALAPETKATALGDKVDSVITLLGQQS